MQVASSNLARLKEDRENREEHGEPESEQQIQTSDQGMERNNADTSASLPESSETAANNQNDSSSTSSATADRLPPGTIHACAQPRRSSSSLRVPRQ
jgi:hypothetical protein